MASNHRGGLGLVNERSGSSRKGRKDSSNKPKQPQRGLGVAQLEMIRLHNQIMRDTCIPYLQSSYNKSLMKEAEDAGGDIAFTSFPSSRSAVGRSSPCGFHPRILIDFEDHGTSTRYCECQSCTTIRSAPIETRISMPQNSTKFPVTLPFLDQTMEYLEAKRRRHDRSYSTSSISQNSDSSGSQEIDLELRLSL